MIDQAAEGGETASKVSGLVKVQSYTRPSLCSADSYRDHEFLSDELLRGEALPGPFF